MSLKYRIVYDDHSKYIKQRKTTPNAKIYIPSLLLILIVLMLLFSPYQASIYEFFLPGDAKVTTNALYEFSAMLDRGETLTNALDTFCETIMFNR